MEYENTTYATIWPLGMRTLSYFVIDENVDVLASYWLRLEIAEMFVVIRGKA